MLDPKRLLDAVRTAAAERGTPLPEGWEAAMSGVIGQAPIPWRNVRKSACLPLARAAAKAPAEHRRAYLALVHAVSAKVAALRDPALAESISGWLARRPAGPWGAHDLMTSGPEGKRAYEIANQSGTDGNRTLAAIVGQDADAAGRPLRMTPETWNPARIAEALTAYLADLPAGATWTSESLSESDCGQYGKGVLVRGAILRHVGKMREETLRQVLPDEALARNPFTQDEGWTRERAVRELIAFLTPLPEGKTWGPKDLEQWSTAGDCRRGARLREHLTESCGGLIEPVIRRVLGDLGEAALRRNPFRRYHRRHTQAQIAAEIREFLESWPKGKGWRLSDFKRSGKSRANCEESLRSSGEIIDEAFVRATLGADAWILHDRPLIRNPRRAGTGRKKVSHPTTAA